MSNQSFMPDPHYQQPRPDEPTEALGYPHQPNQSYPGANNAVGPDNQPNYVRPASPVSSQYEQREEVYADSEQRRANTRYWVAALIYFLLTVLEIILAMRFVFKLFGANSGNGFVAGLYSFSYVFVAPFKGIFTDPSLGYAHVFEVSTIIAMIIYALIAWGLVALSRVVLGPTLTDRRSVTMERQRRDV